MMLLEKKASTTLCIRVKPKNIKYLAFKTSFVRTSVDVARLSFVEHSLNHWYDALFSASRRIVKSGPDNVKEQKERRKKDS